MNRRAWLRWGCGHCAALAGALGSSGPLSAQTASSPAASAPTGSAAEGAWSEPARFTRPDLASDEGGLWAMMDREETRLRRSPFRVRDEALVNYLSDICCRLAGGHCPDVRVYPIRTALFNASMAPNGMMQVWSGLLLRMENEAQLASVIGHEIGHYLQRHTVERMRDVKNRAAFAQFLGVLGLVGAIGQLATVAGMFAFSREHEREADRIGVHLMRQAGYDPREAANVWANLQAELDASPDPQARNRSVLFASHPPSQERRDALDLLALGGSGELHQTRFRQRMAPYRYEWLSDEMRRAQPEESLALLDRLLLGEPGSAELLYFRAEVRRSRAKDGDEALALSDLVAAVQAGAEPAATHRALGYIYRARQDAAQARTAWQRYLELAPASADAAFIRQSLQELPT